MLLRIVGVTILVRRKYNLRCQIGGIDFNRSWHCSVCCCYIYSYFSISIFGEYCSNSYACAWENEESINKSSGKAVSISFVKLISIIIFDLLKDLEYHMVFDGYISERKKNVSYSE